LAHPSPIDEDHWSYQVLDGQLRECYGRVVYAHKTHEKCADILYTHQRNVRITQIVLSAITTAGFIGAVFGASTTSAIIGIVISTTLLALNSYTKNYDHGEVAQKHKRAASDLWLVREKYLSLLADVAIRRRSLDDLQGDRDRLLCELHQVYSGAPSTTVRAYKKAQEALQRRSEMTFSDAEIDAFLPKELRRSSLLQEVLDREIDTIAGVPRDGQKE